MCNTWPIGWEDDKRERGKTDIVAALLGDVPQQR